MDIIVLVLAASATALATGLGAIPVFALGTRVAAWKPALLGFTAGVMTVASVIGLLIPALDEGGSVEIGSGLATGVAFLWLTKRQLAPRASNADMRTAALVFVVLFAHSLPEGLAIGTAYASDTEGLSLFVILAIGIQNVPEGTSIAVPLAAAGYGAARQFWAAVGTSAPQPVGALLAYFLVAQAEALLAWSFAFAAGAMLALVAWELVPSSYSRTTWRSASAGALGGGVLMFALGLLIGV